VLSGDGGLAALIKLDFELMAEQLKVSVQDAQENAASYLAHIREEVNKELSSFSRIRNVSLQDEPFQRTPTLKIKRYLYSLKETITGHKDDPEH
jgi:long-chain acyl-CoA synthetase